MAYRGRARAASRKFARGQANVADVVGAVLSDATHALISKYARRRRHGENPKLALIEGINDVVEEVTGVRIVVTRKPVSHPVTRSAPRSSPEHIDPELERIAQLKKIVDG